MNFDHIPLATITTLEENQSVRPNLLTKFQNQAVIALSKPIDKRDENDKKAISVFFKQVIYF